VTAGYRGDMAQIVQWTKDGKRVTVANVPRPNHNITIMVIRGRDILIGMKTGLAVVCHVEPPDWIEVPF